MLSQPIPTGHKVSRAQRVHLHQRAPKIAFLSCFTLSVKTFAGEACFAYVPAPCREAESILVLRCSEPSLNLLGTNPHTWSLRVTVVLQDFAGRSVVCERGSGAEAKQHIRYGGLKA